MSDSSDDEEEKKDENILDKPIYVKKPGTRLVICWTQMRVRKVVRNHQAVERALTTKRMKKVKKKIRSLGQPLIK